MSTTPTTAVHVFRALPPSGALCALDATGALCEVHLTGGSSVDEFFYRAYAMRPLPGALVGPLRWSSAGGKLEAAALLPPPY